MAENRPFEGLGDILIQYQFRQKQIEEANKRFAEQQKLTKAKLLLDEEEARRDALNRVTELTTRQVQGLLGGATEEERAEFPIDLSKFNISPETKQPVYTAEKGMFGDWYGGLLKRRQGETAHRYRMKEIEQTQKMQATYPEKTTTQPTQYDIWVSQQPEGADTSLEAYKKATTNIKKEPAVDYGKARNYAKYVLALEGKDKEEYDYSSEVQRIAKEIQGGSMQLTEEINILSELVEAQKRAKREKRKFKVDWEAMKSDNPDLDVPSIQLGYKKLGY